MHIRKCQDVYWDPKNEKSWLDREYGGGFQNVLSSSTFVLQMNPFQKSNIISSSSRRAGAEVEEKVSEYTSQLPLRNEVDKGKVWKPRSISPLPFIDEETGPRHQREFLARTDLSLLPASPYLLHRLRYPISWYRRLRVWLGSWEHR